MANDGLSKNWTPPVAQWTPKWAPEAPWQELKKLEYGGDQTLATVLRKIVLVALPEELPGLEAILIGFLNDPQATPAAKDFICRMLAYAGSEACVDAVAPLLADERLSNFARLALEPISGEKVDAALRGALTQLRGAAKAGLIGTIGVRGNDTAAVALLEAIQKDTAESKDVRTAATAAIKHIKARHA